MKRGSRNKMALTVFPSLALLCAALFLFAGCVGDERTAKGKKLYNHYCSHCHGESFQGGESSEAAEDEENGG